MYKHIFIATLLTLQAVLLHAQSAATLIADGDKLYDKKQYQKAVNLYLQALDLNPDDAALNLKAGLSYLYSETKSKAAKYISKAHRLNPKVNDEIDYHLGLAFQNTNDFEKAIEHFEAFKKVKKNLAALADKRIAECQIADSLSQHELNVVIENLGKVNTHFHDYAPIISGDGNTLIFTSNRSEDEKLLKQGKNYEDIYISRKINGAWEPAKKISTNINSIYNDAAASLSPDGKTLFIYYEEGAGDIYTSELQATGEWTKPSPLNRNINTDLFWETSASMSADGKKLYFASNRPGGIGELDLYVSERDGKGNWGKAVNLGPGVNTIENEDSPFIHPDNVTLYFSSDGHPALGNSDIFVSEFRAGKWQKPENLGWPINTWEYDGFFTISADKKNGFFSTLKEGGLGEADIYSITFLEPKFKPKPKPVVVVAAPVVVAEQKKPEPKNTDFVDPSIAKSLTEKVVSVLKGKVIDETTAEPLAATISLVDNETKKVLSKITVDATTGGNFELVIPHGGNYGVLTEKAGYLFNSINFNLPKFAEYQEIDTHIIMVKAEVGSKAVLKNIFFDVGKSDLKAVSLAEIGKIEELLIANADLRVQINGHTDNTGNAASNKTLSLKRASSVVDYLVSHGIAAARVSAKGYGSERPIVSNDDEDSGRELNRRTEIEIVGTGI